MAQPLTVGDLRRIIDKEGFEDGDLVVIETRSGLYEALSAGTGDDGELVISSQSAPSWP